MNHTWPKFDSYYKSMILKLKKISIHIFGMNHTGPKYDSYFISLIHTLKV
jgi:hypothetical protein